MLVVPLVALPTSWFALFVQGVWRFVWLQHGKGEMGHAILMGLGGCLSATVLLFVPVGLVVLLADE